MLSRVVAGSCLFWALFVLPLRGEEPGGVTPEAVFERFQKALGEEKFKIAVLQTTPDSQVRGISDMLGLVMLSGGSGSATPQHAVEAAELDAVLKKHGAGLETVLADYKNMEQLLSRVKDKPACLEECMNCVKKWEGFGDFVGKKNPLVSAEMVNLVVQENEASAKLRMKRNGTEVTDSIKFKKLNGVWLIDSTSERGKRGQGNKNQTPDSGGAGNAGAPTAKPHMPSPNR